MKVKSESEVAQSCLTLSDPMDCSLPGSSVHGISQARVLEWGAIAFSERKYLLTTHLTKNDYLGYKKNSQNSTAKDNPIGKWAKYMNRHFIDVYTDGT